MDMLRLTRSERRGFVLLVLSVALIAAISWLLAGCNDSRGLMTQSTTTERVVTKRDTIIWAPADSALVKLVTDVRAMRALIDELKANGPRTVKGARNAQLIMSVVRDTLLLEARCDSLAQVLESALVTIQEKESRVSELERVVVEKDKSEKGTMPGWMKGIIWIVIIVVAALVVLFILFNQLKHSLLRGR